MPHITTPIVGFVGASGDRRLRAAVDAALAGADELPGGFARVDHDAIDAGLRSARFRSEVDGAARRALDALEGARGLVVGVPVERGSIPGLFKHLFDLADPEQLRDKPTLLLVHRHPGDDETSIRRQADFLCATFHLEPVHEPILVGRGQFSTDGHLLDEGRRQLARAGRTLALSAPTRAGQRPAGPVEASAGR